MATCEDDQILAFMAHNDKRMSNYFYFPRSDRRDRANGHDLNVGSGSGCRYAGDAIVPITAGHPIFVLINRVAGSRHVALNRTPERLLRK